ncbi:MAG: hypothetical protein U1F36_05855 [Planctomycetota bacterium]
MATIASSLSADEIAGLVRLLGFDPWSLTPAERRALRHAYQRQQSTWLPRLARLVEPPVPGTGFPAFLLETPPFSDLREGIGSAASLRDLDTATADRLQRFVDRYRDWLAA